MNNFVGIGRLTRDPEVKWTSGQTPMCIAVFNLAIDRPVKSGGERQADFPRIKAFGKQAEMIEKYLHKGSKIAVNGSVATGSYDKNGLTIYYTEILANRIEFLDGRQKENENVQPPSVSEESYQAVVDDDIPF